MCSILWCVVVCVVCMSTVALERLRAISEARRAAYKVALSQPTTGQPERQINDMLKQIQECHKAVLQDEKTEPLQNMTQIYAHNKMREINDMIRGLTELTNQYLKNHCLAKPTDLYEIIIKKLTATVNFIYNLNQLPQLRRVYQCGEIIHALYYISETPDNNTMQDNIKKIKLIIQYMDYFTCVIIQMQNIAPQVLFIRSEQLQAIIRTLRPPTAL